MPRSARKESGYGIYHVMMRGINRQAIFDDEEDCHRFMDILADLPFQHDDDGRLLPIRTCAIYAWCLGILESLDQGDRNFYTRFYVPEKCV